MKKERGNVITEFLIAAPFVLFLVIASVEIALLYRDRHLLHLAAFEAARVYAESRSTDPCAEVRLKNRAKKVLAVRLSGTVPTIDSLVMDFASVSLPAMAGPLEQLARYPVARLLTSHECRVEDGHVVVKAEYSRPSTMPFVGKAFWVASVVSQSDQKLEWADLWGGVSVKIPGQEFARYWNQTIGELMSFDQIRQLPGMSEANLRIPENISALDEAAQSLMEVVPPALRHLHVTKEVRLKIWKYLREGEAWENAKSYFVAPFTEEPKGDFWKEWTEKLSKIETW